MAVGRDGLPGHGVGAVGQSGQQIDAVGDLAAGAEVADGGLVGAFAAGFEDPDRVLPHGHLLGEGERDVLGGGGDHRPVLRVAPGQRGMRRRGARTGQERAEERADEHDCGEQQPEGDGPKRGAVAVMD